MTSTNRPLTLTLSAEQVTLLRALLEDKATEDRVTPDVECAQELLVALDEVAWQTFLFADHEARW